MARALQSTKGERKDIQSRKSNRQDKEHTKKRTEDDEIDMNGGEQALHGLAPKLNGLAPKRANSAFVRRRKTNNPSLESLSSCQHEKLTIDGVRAPRATQAVLEPGVIIDSLKLPTAALYSSMHAWIGVPSLFMIQNYNRSGRVGVCQTNKTRSLVAVEPRRPPKTNKDTETAFRHDHCKTYPKSKHL